MSVQNHLKLAKEQLERVLAAWDPPDWSDLSLYGFYCLENAVSAAAEHANISLKRTHPAKAEAARELAAAHGLPDVEDLLRQLNDARKATAYGDTPAPMLDAEDVAQAIEDYVAAVEAFLAQ